MPWRHITREIQRRGAQLDRGIFVFNQTVNLDHTFQV